MSKGSARLADLATLRPTPLLTALFTTAIAIALGTALALAAAGFARSLRFVQWFAVIVSLLVVGLDLLPSAITSLGIGALVAFIVALAAPSALHKLSELWSSRDTSRWIGVELAYFGLLLHSFGDGVVLSTLGSSTGSSTGRAVLLAVALHTVPVTAVMVLALREHRGQLRALLSALGLWVATALGLSMARVAPQDWLIQHEGWIGAVVSGLLVHVVFHDVGHRPASQVS